MNFSNNKMPKSNTAMISKTSIKMSTKGTRNPRTWKTLTYYLFETFNYIFNVDASKNDQGTKTNQIKILLLI